jgi:hypothetical protein
MRALIGILRGAMPDFVGYPAIENAGNSDHNPHNQS